MDTTTDPVAPTAVPPPVAEGDAPVETPTAAEWEVAIYNYMNNIRDPELMRQACERMDRRAKANFRRNGMTDIAVELLREARYDEE